jgi:hypothetical protein
MLGRSAKLRLNVASEVVGDALRLREMALTRSEARTSRLIFYAAAIVAVIYGLNCSSRSRNGPCDSVKIQVPLRMLAGCVGVGHS